MRTWFRWVVLVVTSISLTSVAFAANKQTTHPSNKTSVAKTKSLKALAMPAPKPHRILIQVDQNDPAVMNLALNNATNLIDYYRAKQVDIKIDLVAEIILCLSQIVRRRFARLIGTTGE